MSDENIREQDEPEGKINPEDLRDGQVPEEDTEESNTSDQSLENIAREVKAGKWGVGQERRRRLSEAGYDVKEVEAEVVRLLNK